MYHFLLVFNNNIYSPIWLLFDIYKPSKLSDLNFDIWKSLNVNDKQKNINLALNLRRTLKFLFTLRLKLSLFGIYRQVALNA